MLPASHPSFSLNPAGSPSFTSWPIGTHSPLERRSAGCMVRARRPSQDLIPPPPPLLLRDVSEFRSVYRRCREAVGWSLLPAPLIKQHTQAHARKGIAPTRALPSPPLFFLFLTCADRGPFYRRPTKGLVNGQGWKRGGGRDFCKLPRGKKITRPPAKIMRRSDQSQTASGQRVMWGDIRCTRQRERESLFW
ncbi:hypothetical protein LZ31DRAFT_70199 [Colletotrichum somersetense]|nr:hypothetical protein LZ31DRAFT_70199 [Colletotrichum somersetense]